METHLLFGDGKLGVYSALEISLCECEEQGKRVLIGKIQLTFRNS